MPALYELTASEMYAELVQRGVGVSQSMPNGYEPTHGYVFVPTYITYNSTNPTHAQLEPSTGRNPVQSREW